MSKKNTKGAVSTYKLKKAVDKGQKFTDKRREAARIKLEKKKKSKKVKKSKKIEKVKKNKKVN